jgi:hydrogenase nickel incorporation protein HypB
MCRDCGCSTDAGRAPGHHHHDHHHPAVAPEDGRRTVAVGEAILAKNDRLAARNRDEFRARGLGVVNVLSSPGSGKTELLRRTLADLGGRLRAAVIVGDLATDNDARRLRQAGAPVVQITTGSVCHLEADMVARAAEELDLDGLDLLIIENVGNLVCPASYDLGEGLRVVLLSVTEGEDKPLKYPVAFQGAGVVVVSKIDLAEAVGFEREAAMQNIRRVAPEATVLEVSARTGRGLDGWYRLLEATVPHEQRA